MGFGNNFLSQAPVAEVKFSLVRYEVVLIMRSPAGRALLLVFFLASCTVNVNAAAWVIARQMPPPPETFGGLLFTPPPPAEWALDAMAIAAPVGVITGYLTLGAGYLILGAEALGSNITWDCWKPILHETSTAPSQGRPVVDVLSDPRVQKYHVTDSSITLRN